MSFLLEYIHPKSVDKVESLAKELHVRIIVSNPSRSRLGVFIPKSNDFSIIRINNNLNEYNFLITLIHELAHASVWRKFGRKAKPHGEEWKYEFKNMMLPFLNPTFFTKNILKYLSKHLLNPSSSTVTDVSLFETLQQYDNVQKITINNIKDGDKFKMINGKEFERICKLRKHYKCMEIPTKKLYRISPFTEVIVINKFTKFASK